VIEPDPFTVEAHIGVTPGQLKSDDFSPGASIERCQDTGTMARIPQSIPDEHQTVAAWNGTVSAEQLLGFKFVVGDPLLLLWPKPIRLSRNEQAADTFRIRTQGYLAFYSPIRGIDLEDALGAAGDLPQESIFIAQARANVGAGQFPGDLPGLGIELVDGMGIAIRVPERIAVPGQAAKMHPRRRNGAFRCQSHETLTFMKTKLSNRHVLTPSC